MVRMVTNFLRWTSLIWKCRFAGELVHKLKFKHLNRKSIPIPDLIRTKGQSDLTKFRER